jgi:hypothetical protein
MKYELGQKAKDVVTGFTGTITARADYLTGCKQYCVTPRVKPDGEYPNGVWLDEDRIELLDDEKLVLSKPTTDAPKRIGGPQDSPPTY